MVLGAFGPNRLEINIEGDGYHAERALERSPKDGKPVIENTFFRVETPGRGIGAEVFGRQVEQAAALGVARLETHASGAPGDPVYNGYDVWARFGYDAEIPAKVAATLPPSLATATRISDLMTTEAGRTWWTSHGTDFDGIFDLTPGSRSLAIWEAYLARKAATSPTSTPRTSP